MNKWIVLCFFISTCTLQAQKTTWTKLGGAEKIWVLLHPFSAKKAYNLSKQTVTDINSLKSDSSFLITQSGSKFDALRHGYWMSLLSARIGYKRALWLGRAHEKKNRKDFEESQLEDGLLPDSVSIKMDLLNNCVGAQYGKNCKNCTDKQLLISILNAIKKGELFFIKQNEKGQFLDENNKVIPSSEWSGKWKNKRVLVPTDQEL